MYIKFSFVSHNSHIWLKATISYKASIGQLREINETMMRLWTDNDEICSLAPIAQLHLIERLGFILKCSLCHLLWRSTRDQGYTFMSSPLFILYFSSAAYCPLN